MDNLLTRSAALTDIWLDSLTEIASPTADGMTSRYSDLHRTGLLKTCKPFAKNARKATTAHEIRVLMGDRAEKYRFLEPARLLDGWWKLAELYPLVEKALPAQTKPRPEAALPQQGYVDGCRHYARVLTTRSQTGVVGSFLTRSVNQLVNRGYGEQDVDLEMADFLESLASWMEERQQPPDVPAFAEAASPRWLLDEAAWSVHGFWPVPVLARVTRRYRKPEPLARIGTSEPELAPLLIALASDILESPGQESGRELWGELFQKALVCARGDERALTVHVASRLEACRRSPSQRLSAGDWQELLAETAAAAQMGRDLIPPVNPDGTLDWGAVAEKDLQEMLGREYRLEFGDRAEGRPARVHLGQDSDNPDRMAKWMKAGQLPDKELHNQFREVRTRYWKGENVPSLTEWLISRLRSPEGPGWFHGLVETARHNVDGGRQLAAFLGENSLKTYPRLNDRGQPELTADLPPEARHVQRARLQSGGSSRPVIVSVEQFSWSPESCRITVEEPFDSRFQGVRAVLSQHRASVPESLVAPLEDLYRHVADGSDSIVLQATLKTFLANWQTAAAPPRTTEDELLRAVQSVLGQLEPKWTILPSVNANDSIAWKPDDGAEVEYRFDANVSFKEPIRVESYGLRCGDKTLSPPRVAVSAGPEPTEYRDILERLPRIEEEFGPETAEMLRTLPGQIVSKSHEALCSDLFKRLWPIVDRSRAEQLSRDAGIGWIRTWFEKRILGMVSAGTTRRLRINTIHPGDSLVALGWRTNSDYQEEGGPRGGEFVDIVVRPQLLFVMEGELRSPVKERAVLYVKE